jgi:prevent-host-death family protein
MLGRPGIGEVDAVLILEARGGLVEGHEDAKNHFSEVVDCALHDGPQTVTRHGREAVVVVAFDDYKHMARPEGSLVDFLRRSPLWGVELELERAG